MGGGHSHVQVVKYFDMHPAPGVRVTLISEQAIAAYSGMLPGCLAGQYQADDIHIKLMPLCAHAGVRFIQAQVSGLDLHNNRIVFDDRPPIAFDVLSINCGAQPRVVPELGIAVKPISDFLPTWHQALATIKNSGNVATTLSVVGAGAGGVEIALASRAALPDQAAIRLYGPQLLKDHSPAARRQVRKVLAEKRIEHIGERYQPEDKQPPERHVFWVTEVKAPGWVAGSGLDVDDQGFVRVDECLRSISNDNVFAAGDIAHLMSQQRPKAGVYAVRAGPVLARNLGHAAQGLALHGRKHRYVAQRSHLNLINCADGTAIASRGWWASRNRLWWWLKDRIDRAFIARFNELAVMPDTPMTVSAALSADLPDETMRCGGCGAKVAAQPLRRVLARLPKQEAAYVSLGIGDDAAQIVNQSDQTLLSVDGFRAMIDDPYRFGRIAAHHSLNDIYAMAAQPTAALAFVTLPLMATHLMEEELFQVLSGAVSVLNAAGAPLVGGHSAEGAELSIALTVTGSGSTQALTKGRARQGDVLILTKALGTGVLLAAAMRGNGNGDSLTSCVASMDQSNATAVTVLQQHGARALTDITGFGFLGHLGEMLRASELGVSLNYAAIARLPGAAAALAAGVRSSLHRANELVLRDYQISENISSEPGLGLLVDPQTSGGLLAAVPAEQASPCVAALHAAGFAAAQVVGELQQPGRQNIH